MLNLEQYLPDPYKYPHNYFQVLVPEPMPVEIDPDNLSETGPAPKVATFKKVRWVEDNGARSLKWVHEITQ